MASPVSQYTRPVDQCSRSQAEQTSFFATDGFIKAQRLIAVMLIVASVASSAIVAASAGAGAGVAGPLLVLGSCLLGASLIQQALGNAPNCTEAKTRRAVAGALIMLFPVIGWIPGAILWYQSAEANRRAASAA